MMDLNSHQELAETARKMKGFVVVSHYPSNYYRNWYEDFGWLPISTQSSDGSSQKGKSLRTEVIYLNPRAAEAQRQMRMFC